jgi:hypothetical protein
MLFLVARLTSTLAQLWRHPPHRRAAWAASPPTVVGSWQPVGNGGLLPQRPNAACPPETIGDLPHESATSALQFRREGEGFSLCP